MNNKDIIVKTLKMLDSHGIKSTQDFVKDLNSLISGNASEFLRVMYKDFLRWESQLNKFETLKLNPKQKSRINGLMLRRYEYRRNKANIKCIFIVVKENNSDMPIILCAFIEDGDKKKGKNSYNDNIERAISIFEKIQVNDDEN